MAAAAALLFAGCAQENPNMIPREDAEALIASVEEVGTAVSGGECAQARVELEEARLQVDGLPTGVAERLTERLSEGLAHLESQIPLDCLPEAEATATPTVTPEPDIAPEPTETAPPAETPTPTPVPEETPAPEEVEPEDGDGVSGEEDEDEQ